VEPFPLPGAAAPTGTWPRALSFHPDCVLVSVPSRRLCLVTGDPLAGVTVIWTATMTLAVPACGFSAVSAPSRIRAVVTVLVCAIWLVNCARPLAISVCSAPVEDCSHSARPAATVR